MVITFRIVSDEVDNFVREIQIDSNATFLDLRNAICRATGFSQGQMHSFFLCEDGWEKNQEITLDDMGSDSDQEVYLMEETPLGDFVEDEGQRLIFTFDYLTDRSLFMEAKKTEPGKSLAEPVCSRSQGNAPHEEVDLDDFDAQIDAKAAKAAAAKELDLDEDFYGSTEFNEDEFDVESFDELTFDN